MLSLTLCAVACVLSFLAGRRSLVDGLGVVFAIGYAYGITRANIAQPASHFIFDGAVIGLFCAQLGRRLSTEQWSRIHELNVWTLLLVGWPLLLLLVPLQDLLVRFVGFRGNVFLLPFLVFGARLDSRHL